MEGIRDENVERRWGRGRRHKFELRVINRTLFTVRAPRYRCTITYTVTRNMRVERFSRYYTHSAPPGVYYRRVPRVTPAETQKKPY